MSIAAMTTLVRRSDRVIMALRKNVIGHGIVT